MWIPLTIIALALAMVIGPIMLMRPTKRQQRLVKLREEAAKNGLQVRMLPVPRPGESSGRSVPSEAQELVAVYSLPWSKKDVDTAPWLLARGKFAHELHFSGQWQWVDKAVAAEVWHQPLHRALAGLPSGVLAIGNGPQGLHVYWREDEQEATVVALREILEDLRQSQL